MLVHFYTIWVKLIVHDHGRKLLKPLLEVTLTTLQLVLLTVSSSGLPFIHVA